MAPQNVHILILGNCKYTFCDKRDFVDGITAADLEMILGDSMWS